MLFIINKYKVYKREISYFVFFYILTAIGASIILFRESLPIFASIIVANTILFIARLFLLRGILLFFKKSISKTLLYLSAIAYISLIIFFTYINPNVVARIVVYALSMGIIHSIVIYNIKKNYRLKNSNKLLIVPINISYILYFVSRIVLLYPRKNGQMATI